MGFDLKFMRPRWGVSSSSAKGRTSPRWKSFASNGTPTLSRLARLMAIGRLYGSSPSPLLGSLRSGANPKARSSDLTRATREERLEAGFFVMDSISHRRREGDPSGPGVILVLRDCHPENPESLIGVPALIHSIIGMVMVAPVAAVRDHGSTISVLIEGLSRDAVPIGSDLGFVLDAARGVRIPGNDLASLLRTRKMNAARDEPSGQAVLQ